jgi:uncharacterized protein
MLENDLIFIYFCLIVALQSSIGVGVLVLGTPFLLLLGYNMIEVLFILLPLSILTSLINLIIIRFSDKNLNVSTHKGLIKFFIVCVPSIIIGLFILKYFQEFINFKLLVALVIIISFSLMLLKDKIKIRFNFFRISILSIVGLIHGLTNSGGTLMSMALSSNNKKDNARYSITFFYLALATLQYFTTIIVFKNLYFLPINFYLFLSLIGGVFLGNILIKFLSENKYKIIINTLALGSSIILLINI